MFRLLLVVSILLIPSPQAFSENSITDDLMMLHQMAESDRQKILTKHMGLTEEEKREFWPLYREYQAETTKIADTQYALIADLAKSYATLTDEQALTILDTVFDSEAKRNKVRKKYFKRFKKILSGKKVARFYQIDQKIELALKVHLTRQIPLIK